jgi:hypothetical protein
MKTSRKSTLVLALALLTTGIGNGIAQTVPIPPPSQASPDGGPNPNCIPGVTCGSTGN